MEESLGTLLGWEIVKLSDGREIQVKQLPVRKFPDLLLALDNEPQMVELCTGLKPEEMDALLIEDFELLFAKGGELNLPPFSRWLKRRKEAAQKLQSLYAESSESAQTVQTLGANGAST